MNSLRAQLVLFWAIVVTVCGALAFVMVVLFRQSAGSQIEAVQARAEAACASIATRYAKSLADPQRSAPQLDLLQVLLQLVLIEEPHVEGGVWSAGGGFLAYAYPTYEGSSVKRDVPEAEQAHIAEVARTAARTQRSETDVVRASREALVVSACPLQSPRGDLAGWTMTRTSLGTLDAQRSLRIGLGALLAFVLASGLWLGLILLRGYRHVQRLEGQLAQADGSAAARAHGPARTRPPGRGPEPLPRALRAGAQPASRCLFHLSNAAMLTLVAQQIGKAEGTSAPLWLSAGVFGVMLTLMVSDLTRGSGRFNFALGIAAVAVGLGAALSNLVAGTIAQASGYATSFVVLAGVAAAALALFTFGVPETRHCGAARTSGAAPDLTPEAAA